MAPATHLLASWIIAAKTTDNPRDCRLVTLAGIVPDLDGLGMLADYWNGISQHKVVQFYWYQQYHHFLWHGIFGAVVTAVVLAFFARRRWRVAILALIVFHLHLLCDLVGSRGPDPEDLWPIFYLAPFSQHPMWIWKHQWPLYGWTNGVISVVLFVWAIWLTMERGDSFIGVFNRKADRLFVGMLQRWRGAWRGLRKSGEGAD